VRKKERKKDGYEAVRKKERKKDGYEVGGKKNEVGRENKGKNKREKR
jgi:hypothetical protein